MTKMEVLQALKIAGAAGAAAAKKYNTEQTVVPGMTLELEFVQYENPLSKANEVERWKFIDTYPCGLGWVVVSTFKNPKTTSFIKVMKEMGFVIEDTNGGRNEPEMPTYHNGEFRQDAERHTVYTWCVPGFNQSMQLPTEYAKAFSEVLTKLGICATYKQWID